MMGMMEVAEKWFWARSKQRKVFFETPRINEEEFGHFRPIKNIVTDADKEPGNLMQVIAVDIIGISGSERSGLGNGHYWTKYCLLLAVCHC